MQNLALKAGGALLLSIILIITGCSLTVTKAGADGTIVTGILNVSFYIEAEATDDDDDDENENDPNFIRGLFSQIGGNVALSNAISEIDLTVVGDNASIPDQAISLTLSVSNSSGLQGAKTFNGNINNGLLTLLNPSEVQNWLTQFSHLEDARLDIDSDVEIDLPESGSYQLTNALHYAGTVLASNTSSGYVDPGGGSPPVVVQ